FSTGDVILEVAGKSVSTPADVRDVVASARTEGKRSVLLRVKKVTTHGSSPCRLPAAEIDLGTTYRHPSPPLVGLPSTGRASRPCRQIPEGGGPLTAAFRASSSPGIRRPRWGGVAVGVAVSPPPPRVSEIRGAD